VTTFQEPRPGDPTFIDASPGDEVPKNVPIFLEIGRSGLKRVSGYVDDEFLPQLRGRKAVKIYREIADNSAVIGAFLMAVRLLLRQLEWRVEPASGSAEDEANAQFVEECMHDMEAPWGEVIYEMANFLVYGWSLHEPVYKRRVGPWEKNPVRRSKFTDGRIGWRKMPGRAQETMWRWVFDDVGDILAMVQMAPPKYQKVVIPLERCLLFRTTIEKNNPEGRAESPENVIYTPSGWRRFGDLLPGDQVFGIDGRPVTVCALRRWVDRPRYRVCTDSGELGIYDARHLWRVNTAQQRNKNRDARVLTTEQIVAGMEASVVNRPNGIPVAEPLAGTARELPVPAWTLGYWLGNGSRSDGQLSCHSADVDELMALLADDGFNVKHGHKARKDNGARLDVRGLAAPLRDLGVQARKHVPAAYLHADEVTRRALLAGLLDADGHCDTYGRVEFCNTNKDLIDAVVHLVRSLGMKAFVTLSRPAIPEKNWQQVWDVKFTPPRPVFRLSRKNAFITDDHLRIGTHFITRVEPVGHGETMCIEIDAADHLYLSGQLLVPTHNSLLRNSYVSWFFLKRFQEIEATGVARDLAGMPIAKVPPKLWSAAKGSQDAKMLAAVTTLVQKVNRNENEGIVWPWLIDEESKQPLYDFSLLTSGGSRQFDTESIISRYKLEMLQSLLADFMEVGHESSGGSYALHTDKSGLFRTALNAFAKQIADTINRHGLTRLFALNGMRPDQMPKIKPNDVDPPALDELGAFMQALVGAGMTLFPDPTLEAFIRDAARLPKLDPQVEAIHETEQRQGAVLDLVNQRLQLLQAEQQAQMGQQQMAQAGMQTATQAAGALDQADQLENPQQDPNAAAQAQLGTQTQQVKLAQEKTKLAQLRNSAQAPQRPQRQGPPLKRPPRARPTG
jgi:hypothetical protein